MARVLMNDPATSRIALFEEASGGGAFDDPNSNRNRPLNDPASWLDLVKFHSDFDYYQVHSGPTAVTVNHASVAGASTTLYNLAGATFTKVGQIATAHYDLVTHGLGYVPRYMIVLGGKLLAPGTLVQTASSGRMRTITPYATATKIRLYEAAISSASDLSAVSLDYEVLVFKRPEADSDHAIDFDPSDGRLILGYGKFDSALKMLRKAGASASPFDIPLGRTADITNGAARTVQADGTTESETNYDGSFTGSPSIQCAVD